MSEEIITQETVLEKVRQRLGSLEGNAEQAVAEALAILNESQQTFQSQTAEKFVGVNVSVAQYEAWSPEERFLYLDNAEEANKDWIARQFQELNAIWMMVIDGQVVAHNEDFQKLLREHEFDALCKKYGKYPFVFFSPRLFMIEEMMPWHKTNEPDDMYPTVSVKVRGGNKEMQFSADFDTGAIEASFDLKLLFMKSMPRRPDCSHFDFPVLSFAQIGSPPETLFGARLDYARCVVSENSFSATDAVTLTWQF